MKHSVDPAQADRILGNRFYKNISGALSGTQEYMAMEKLYELHCDNDFDLVVVDTPPTRHALDFLDAPRRLTRFLDHRLYRILMAPTRGLMKAANVAAQAFVRTLVQGRRRRGDRRRDHVLHRVLGHGGGLQGPGQHGVRAARLAARPRSCSSRHRAATPSRRPTSSPRRLHESGIDVRALIVNRMHPKFGDGLAEATRERARTLDGHRPRRSLREPRRLPIWSRRSEEEHLSGLAERVAPAPVVRVPFLRSDVHDLDGLAEVGEHLFAPAER